MKYSHRPQCGPFGFIIQVGLNVGTQKANAGLGGPPFSKNGLIDTGACVTAISQGVYQSLQPQRSGTTTINRPNQSKQKSNTYAVRLKFEGYLRSNPWFDLDVVVANAATPGIDVLIGMDVLSRLVMFYEGGMSGTMILTYS